MNKRDFLLGTAALGIAAATPVLADTPKDLPKDWPKDWIDKDTGHRVVRLSSQDHSQSLYFNFPAFSPDGRWMVFNTPAGINLTDMTTLAELRNEAARIEGGGDHLAEAARRRPHRIGSGHERQPARDGELHCGGAVGQL